MDDQSAVKLELKRNKRDIARAKSMYDRQKKIVDQLRSMKRDTHNEVRLLEALSDSLSSYVATRDRLTHRLSNLNRVAGESPGGSEQS